MTPTQRRLGFSAHHRIRALNIHRTTPRIEPRPTGLALAVLSLLAWVAAGLIFMAVLDMWAPFLRGWLL